MKAYRLERISDDGQSYTGMIVQSEAHLKTRFGDADSAKMIAGTHPQWHLAETLEFPDPPTE
jgi:hypothetical protein